jgi:hypothetical protein
MKNLRTMEMRKERKDGRIEERKKLRLKERKEKLMKIR